METLMRHVDWPPPPAPAAGCSPRARARGAGRRSTAQPSPRRPPQELKQPLRLLPERNRREWRRQGACGARGARERCRGGGELAAWAGSPEEQGGPREGVTGGAAS